MTRRGGTLLRALRARAVANPDALGTPAALCSVDDILAAIQSEAGPPVEYLSRGAGWSWGEVLSESARLVGLDPAWAEQPVRPSPPARTGVTPMQAAGIGARLAMLAIPPNAIDGPADTLPVPQGAIRLARKVLQPASSAGPEIPPTLPMFSAMPDARREQGALDGIAQVVARVYHERGYGTAWRYLTAAAG